MKVGILAGGLGSRLSEETVDKPKPMVEIGGKPVLWHIMSYYAAYGHDEFVVALGYKGEYIKRWMVGLLPRSPLTSAIDMRTGEVGVIAPATTRRVARRAHRDRSADRHRRPHQAPRPAPRKRHVHADLGRRGLRHRHRRADRRSTRQHGKLCTLTAVRPPARFGHLEMDGDAIVEFSEKPQTGEGWINGAFFVCEPERVRLHRRRHDAFGNASRSSGWPRTASSWRTATSRSGSAWTPCATSRAAGGTLGVGRGPLEGVELKMKVLVTGHAATSARRWSRCSLDAGPRGRRASTAGSSSGCDFGGPDSSTCRGCARTSATSRPGRLRRASTQ